MNLQECVRQHTDDFHKFRNTGMNILLACNVKSVHAHLKISQISYISLQDTLTLPLTNISALIHMHRAMKTQIKTRTNEAGDFDNRMQLPSFSRN